MAVKMFVLPQLNGKKSLNDIAFITNLQPKKQLLKTIYFAKLSVLESLVTDN